MKLEKSRSNLESRTDTDFRKRFETLLKKVDFSGCKTPEDVNERLLAKIKELESESPNSDDSENRGVK